MSTEDMFVLRNENEYDLYIESYNKTDSIFPGAQDADTWILGLNYLKKYYAIFNRDTM